MLDEIGTVENIPEFIEGVKNRKRKMSGFRHCVYKNYDHRVKVIKKLAEEVFPIVVRDPLIEVAIVLEKDALSDEYFVKRKLYPNSDFYSGLICRAIGFPTEFFPVLFAIPRMAGYFAHWRESLDDPDTKIMRPKQVSSSVNEIPNMIKYALQNTIGVNRVKHGTFAITKRRKSLSWPNYALPLQEETKTIYQNT